MCGERTFTRATGESEYPRQESHGGKHGQNLVGNSGQQKAKRCFTRYR